MRRTTVIRAFYAVVVIVWLTSMAMLVNRHYGILHKQISLSHSGMLSEKFYGEHWMGIYFQDEKIGYSRRSFEKEKNGYKIMEFMKMNIRVMDAVKTIETVTRAYMDNDLKLDSFDLSINADLRMSIHGKRQGSTFLVVLETADKKSEHVFPFKDTPSMNITMIPELLKEGLDQKKKYSFTIINPSVFSQEKIILEVTGKELLMSMGRQQEVFKLKGTLRNIDFYIWITENGEVLREDSPLGFTFIKEREENAKQIGKPSLDLIRQVSVPFNLKLPSRTRYLRLKISGIDLTELDIDGGRQNLKNNILEITREELSSSPRNENEAINLDDYLNDSVFIQSKDPWITSHASKIVHEEKDILGKARLLYDWVYHNIEKIPTISVPSAVDVLRSRKGDCNEHTTLYIALARAAGIPARVALGLVYKDGLFYYHAWPEIFISRWIAIDPTLGQFPADAAHIRLVIGDFREQVHLLSVIGKIELEGLNFN